MVFGTSYKTNVAAGASECNFPGLAQLSRIQDRTWKLLPTTITPPVSVYAVVLAA